MEPTDQTEIRTALRGRRITDVEVSISDLEFRSLTLFLDDHTSVEILATAYQALRLDLN